MSLAENQCFGRIAIAADLVSTFILCIGNMIQTDKLVRTVCLNIATAVLRCRSFFRKITGSTNRRSIAYIGIGREGYPLSVNAVAVIGRCFHMTGRRESAGLRYVDCGYCSSGSAAIYTGTAIYIQRTDRYALQSLLTLTVSTYLGILYGKRTVGF